MKYRNNEYNKLRKNRLWNDVKCIEYCIDEKLGLIVNGKYSPEVSYHVTKIMATQLNIDEVKAPLGALKCARKVNKMKFEDKCDIALVMLECQLDYYLNN